jgi:hypothetical protein
MGMIQISELARELEVKYSAVIEYLVSLGVMERMSPSFVLTGGLADQVREHFRAEDQGEGGGASSKADAK